MEKSGGWLSETFQSTVWDVKSVQTMSDYPIKIIFRKRNTTKKEIFLYVFSHAK